MKKSICLFIALVLSFSLTACTNMDYSNFEDADTTTTTIMTDAKTTTTVDITTTTIKPTTTTTTKKTTTTSKSTTTSTTQKSTTTTKATTTTTTITTTTTKVTTTTTKATIITTETHTDTDDLVWIPTNGGKKYHSKSSCSNMINPIQVTKSEAIDQGFGPCGRCYK